METLCIQLMRMALNDVSECICGLIAESAGGFPQIPAHAWDTVELLSPMDPVEKLL